MWQALSLILLLILSLVLVKTGLLSEFNTPVEYASLLLGGSIFASIGFIAFRLRVWSGGVEAFFKERPASSKPGPSAFQALVESTAAFLRVVGVGITMVVTVLEYYDRHDLVVGALTFIVTKMGKLVTALTH